MPPKAVTVSQWGTCAGVQRILQSQTSGIFKLPFELLLEIFSNLNDHRDFIKETPHIGLHYSRFMEKENIERSTIIRNLTMTCWPLRHVLLPVLWKEAEGCMVRWTYGLYSQCEYLLSNPTVAAYVQVFTVELVFKSAPKDLMTKFVDTLLRLPNLRRLELLRVTHRSHFAPALKHKRTIFPNIREVLVDHVSEFIQSCPNLESLTVRSGLCVSTCRSIELYGTGLKRVTGVDFLARHITTLARCCPMLQEIGLVVELLPIDRQVFDELRRIEHLTIIEVNLIQYEHHIARQDGVKDAWSNLKRGFIEVLKNNTSEDRKLLRWRTVGRPRPGQVYQALIYGLVESGEMRVFPETSL